MSEIYAGNPCKRASRFNRLDIYAVGPSANRQVQQHFDWPFVNQSHATPMQWIPRQSGKCNIYAIGSSSNKLVQYLCDGLLQWGLRNTYAIDFLTIRLV
jgi:hypothetical protein